MSNIPKTNNIKVEMQQEGFVIFTMNRPEAMNALNSETLEELRELVKWVEDDKEVSGIIITGTGKAFVAGADIKQMKDYKAEEGRKCAALAQEIFNRLENIEKPVIAAVNGYALGGGCELCLSCDIRIASKNAVFGQPEVNLGIIPCFGGTQRLSRLIGVGRAKEMIYTGRNVDANEAYSFGLVNKVVDGDNLISEAKNMMGIIIAKAPLAIKYSKIAINNGIQVDITRGLEIEKDVAALAFASNDKDEGMNAFIEKRKAIFQNK